VKNILLVNTYYHPNGRGGAERSTRILAESLAELGFRVSVITTSNICSTVTINGVDVYYVNMGNLYWLQEANKHSIVKKMLWHLVDSYGLNDAREFEAIVQKIKPDIVLTNNLVQFSCKVFKVLRKLNIPILHIIRDHYLMDMSTVMYKDMSFWRRMVTGRMLSVRKKKYSQYVNGVIGISEYIIQKHLANGYFKNAVIKAVIPNAIASCNKFEVKSKSGKPIFGYVGALNPRKGVDLIVEVFARKSISNSLFLFGSGSESYVQKLFNISSQHPNIQCRGYKSPDRIFREIDILIVPSLINEAFGRVIIEAYSYGIPVIGSNRGGIPELIDVNKTGFIFDPDIKDSLINTIEENSLDKFVNPELKNYSFEKSKLFLSEVVVNKYLDVFTLLKKVL